MILILPLQPLQPSRFHRSAQPPNHFISSTERDGMSAQRSSSVGGLREPRLPPSLPAVHQRPPDIQSPTVATARTRGRRYAGYLRPHLPTDRPTSGPQESGKARRSGGLCRTGWDSLSSQGIAKPRTHQWRHLPAARRTTLASPGRHPAPRGPPTPSPLTTPPR